MNKNAFVGLLFVCALSMHAADAFTPAPVSREFWNKHSLRGNTAVSQPSRKGGIRLAGSTGVGGASELDTVKKGLWNQAIQVDWESFYRTVEHEKSYYSTDIEGEIPVDFAASIFRNGPGRFDRGGKRYEHVLDGECECQCVCGVAHAHAMA